MLSRCFMTLIVASSLMLVAADEEADQPNRGSTESETAPKQEANTTGVPGVGSRYIVLPKEPGIADFWGEIGGNGQEDDLVLLRRARLKAAQDAIEAAQIRFDFGGIAGDDGFGGTSEQIYKASRLVLEARLEAAETDAELLAAWEEYLPHARNWEWLTQRRSEQALEGGGSIELAATRATRMEAEIHVLKLRRQVYEKK